MDPPLVAPALLPQSSAAIAYGASQYLAVWVTNKPAGTQAVLGVRVSPSGEVLTDPPLTIADDGDSLETPAVAFDGQRFFVTWLDLSNGKNIIGCYVDSMGTLSPRINVTNDAPIQDYNAVAAGEISPGNGSILVSWTDSRTITTTVRASLYDDAGTLVRGDFLVSNNALVPGNNAYEPTTVWGGASANSFLVAWVQGDAVNRPVYGAVVDSSGTNSVPERISTVGQGNNPDFGLCCDSDSTGCGGSCSCCDDQGPFGTCCGDEQFTQIDFVTNNPIAASSGSNYLVAWEDNRDLKKLTAKGSTIYGRMIPSSYSGGALPGSDAKLASPPPPAAPPAPQSSHLVSPQLTFAGGKFVGVWLGFSNSIYKIMAGRFNPTTGAPLDGDGLAATDAPRAILPVTNRRSAMASDGTLAMTAFVQGNNAVTSNDILLLETDPAQAPTTKTPRLLSRAPNYQFHRNVASNGQVFLLTWEDNRNLLTTGVDLYGLRVDSTGKAIDLQPFVICNQPGDQFLPTASAFPGGEFLVVWADGRDVIRNAAVNNQITGGRIEIFGARVGASGAPLGVAGGFRITTSAGTAGRARLAPTVAAKNDGWLVAWEDWRIASIRPRPAVWSTVVSNTEQVGTEQQITVPSDEDKIACNAAAVWNGSRFFVAYEQPCTVVAKSDQSFQKGDVFGNWVANDGTVDLLPVTVANSIPDSETGIQLVADPNKRIAVVWRSGTDTIRAGLLADGADSLSKASVIATGRGTRESPSVAFAPSGSSGNFVITWVDTSPVGVRAVRTDVELVPFEEPFLLTSAATFRAEALPPGAPDLSGANESGTPRSTPPAAAAALFTGEALVDYGLLQLVGDVSYPRLHYRTFGLRTVGAPCSAVSACVAGFCTGGVCCATACDGVCQACSANGCVETPATDSRCGANGGIIQCSSLSSTCRSFADQPINRCSAFGQCAEAGSLDECVNYTNAADGTACNNSRCGDAAMCVSGSCLCEGEMPPTVEPRGLPPAADCTIAGRDGQGSAAGAWLLLGVLALLARRRLRV